MSSLEGSKEKLDSVRSVSIDDHVNNLVKHVSLRGSGFKSQSLGSQKAFVKLKDDEVDLKEDKAVEGPLIERSQKSAQSVSSQSEESAGLNEEDKKKLTKILNKLQGKADEDEEVDLTEIVEQLEEDPLENLKEGIFIFEAKNGCFSLPVAEADYLKNYTEASIDPSQQQEAVILDHQGEVDEKLGAVASLAGNQSGLMQSKAKLTNSWDYAKKIVVYDHRSLFLFHHNGYFRRIVVAITENSIFDNLIISLIFLNSVCLVMTDYKDRDNLTKWNQWLEFFGNIFSYCFMIECVLKVCAQGFFRHYNAYLRDTWNWIDFTVVLISVVELTPIEGANLKGLRTLRVLRPLRSINAFPSMKRLITSLTGSLAPLGYAVAFMVFIFLLFGILGVSQFGGAFYQRCRLTLEPVNGVWPFDKEVDRLCSLDGSGLYQCPDYALGGCGTPVMKNLSLSTDHIENQDLINYGITTFDNLLLAQISIFQMITLEGWVNIMYNLMDAGMPWMAILFCVLLVVICALFLLNIILAVLSEGIANADLEDPEENRKKIAISTSMLRAKKQRDNALPKPSQVIPDKKQILAQPTIQNVQGVRPSEAFGLGPSPTLEDGAEAEALPQIEADKDESKMQLVRSASEPNIMNAKRESDKIVELFDVDNQSPRSQSNSGSGKSSIISKEEVAREEELPKEIKDNLEAGEKKIADTSLDHSSNASQKAAEKYIPTHSKKNCFYMTMYRICSHDNFTAFVTILILGNTAVLACDRLGIEENEQNILDNFNSFFTWAFVAEMVIKLFGLGFKEYAKDTFNVFDAVVVALSLIELVLGAAGVEDMAGGAFSAIRSIRLLRVFKLARSWTALYNLLLQMLITLKDISTFAVLLLIVVFIFMLLGLELFAYKINFDSDGNPTNAPSGIPPRENFNTPLMAFISIFIVFIGDDWNAIMYNHYRAFLFDDEQHLTSSKVAAYGAITFFVVLFIVGNLVLMNLFLAILLSNFEPKEDENGGTEEDEEGESDSDELSRWEKIKTCCKQFCKCCRKKTTILDEPSIKAEEKDNNDSFAEASDISDKEAPGNSQNALIIEDQGQLARAKSENPQRSSLFLQKVEASRRATVMLSLSEINTIQATKTEDAVMKRRNTFAILKSLKRKAELEERATKLDELKNTKKVSMSDLKKIELKDTTIKKVAKPIDLKGNAFYCFGPKNPVRYFGARITHHEHFDTVVLMLIVISTVLLCMEQPLDDPDSQRVQILGYLDTVMSICFIIECLLKNLVLGFACNGSGSYIREPWNVMDFVIVLLSLVDFLPIDTNISFIKVIRLMRVIRPLRMISKNPGLKIAIESLIKVIPGITNLSAISVLVILLFAILGTTFYKGLFFSCHMDNIPEHLQGEVFTMWECMDYGGEWINSPDNFDNVFASMITFFIALTTEGWVGIMWNAVDANEQFMMPIKNNSPLVAIFFCCYIIVGALFIFNLFVGVVISTFSEEKEKLVRNNLLTPLQMEYCDTMTKCFQAKCKIIYQQTGNKFKDNLHAFATSKHFDNFIFACIVINTMCMAATYYGQSEDFTNVMDKVNLVFAIIYTIEAIIKLMVFKKVYFSDGWNNFDFVIVVMAWLGVLVEKAFKLNVGPVTTVIRSFRIARVFKMIKRFKELSKIFNTMLVSIPALANVGSLLGLLLLLYSVLGVFFFAKIKLQDSLNYHANFQTFGTAMLTLLRCTTGEAFNEIMTDAGRERSIAFQCIEKDMTYEELQKQGVSRCGDRTTSNFYFISFQLIGAFVFLNMFIAIILEGFEKVQQEEKMRITEEAIDLFIKVWSKYDPSGSYLIKIDDLALLLTDLAEQELIMKADKKEMCMFDLTSNIYVKLFVQWKKNIEPEDNIKQKLGNILSSQLGQKKLTRSMNRLECELQVPTYNGMKQYNFHDCICALTKHVFATSCKRDFEERKEKIRNLKLTGQTLSRMDRMKEGTPVFWKLSDTKREQFLEINDPDFDQICNRLETKGLNDEMPIAKVVEMKQERIKIGLTLKDQIDEFKDPSGNADLDLILDSSKVFGALIIKVHVVRLVKKQRLKKIEAEKLKEAMVKTQKEPTIDKDEWQAADKILPETDTEDANLLIVGPKLAPKLKGIATIPEASKETSKQASRIQSRNQSIGLDDLDEDSGKEDGEKIAKAKLALELQAAVNDIVSPKSIEQWNSNGARAPLPEKIGNGLTYTKPAVSQSQRQISNQGEIVIHPSNDPSSQAKILYKDKIIDSKSGSKESDYMSHLKESQEKSENKSIARVNREHEQWVTDKVQSLTESKARATQSNQAEPKTDLTANISRMDKEAEEIKPTEYKEMPRQNSTKKTQEYYNISPYDAPGMNSANRSANQIGSPMGQPMRHNFDRSPDPMPEVLWVNYLGDAGRRTNYIEKPITAVPQTIYESLIAKRKPKSKKKQSNSRKILEQKKALRENRLKPAQSQSSFAQHSEDFQSHMMDMKKAANAARDIRNSSLDASEEATKQHRDPIMSYYPAATMTDQVQNLYYAANEKPFQRASSTNANPVTDKKHLTMINTKWDH